jgi:hypothetical protein
VFTDSWANGWTAVIDGEAVPVLKVSDAVRGVMVPAGQHVLEWHYSPPWLAMTLAAMATGLLGSIALILWPWGRQGQIPETPVTGMRSAEIVTERFAISQEFTTRRTGIGAFPQDAIEPFSMRRLLLPMIIVIGMCAFSLAMYSPDIDGPSVLYRNYLLRTLGAAAFAWIILHGIRHAHRGTGLLAITLVMLPPLALQAARHVAARQAPLMVSDATSVAGVSQLPIEWEVIGTNPATVDQAIAPMRLFTDGRGARAIRVPTRKATFDAWAWWERPIGQAPILDLDVVMDADIRRSGPYLSVFSVGRLMVQAVNGGLLVTSPDGKGDVTATHVKAADGRSTWMLSVHKGQTILTRDNSEIWRGTNRLEFDHLVIGDASRDREHGGTVEIHSLAIRQAINTIPLGTGTQP